MKKNVLAANLAFVLLVILVLSTSTMGFLNKVPFLCVILLCHLLFAFSLWHKRAEVGKGRSVCDIVMLIYLFLFFWELCATTLGITNKVLFPCPEQVFQVFVSQRALMLRGLFSSLQLLLTGFCIALPLAVLLGLLVGWQRRLRDTIFPIAKVLSPIPPIIYTPYIIAIMPSFRSASAMVLILGIFWPAFLNVIVKVSSVDRHILASAKVMCVNDFDMIFKVLLPYVFPGTLSGLKVTLSTSFMILTIAEMMGATSGLGYFIKNFSDYGNYTNVVAGILLVAVVITVLNKFLSLLEHRLIKWYP